MKIGRKLYFEKSTGNVILDTGEKQGYVVDTTFEQDLEIYAELASRNVDSFSYIQLEFGDYSRDFIESTGYRVNPESLEIEFQYSDEENPEAPAVFQKPLTEQIKDLEKKTDQAIMELTMVIAMGGM